LGEFGWGDCDAPPAQSEVCNGADDDCDGSADEGFPDIDIDGIADCVDSDSDNDTVPDPDDNCPLSANPAQVDTDDDGLGDSCDDDDDNDGDPDISDCEPQEKQAHHGAVEVCDGLDNNCNGQVDEGYADADFDGLANCTDPDDDNDGVLDDEDCEPTDMNSYPGATEACDGLDNNCNDKVDEGFPDSDEDGMANCVDPDADGDEDPDVSDCAPLDPAIFSDAPEECDGADNNCNGQVDEGYSDFDQDGGANCIDLDDDNDGDPDVTDCAPMDADMFTGAEELCDMKDNNCNGIVDEGC